MRTNTKRAAFVLGTLALTASMIAGTGVMSASADSSDLKPVTLTFWTCGDQPAAQEEVMKAFCDKYRDQLNIDSIQFNYVSFGDYEDKMTSLVAGGDDFDAFFVADWMLYSKMANRGAFLELNDLMQEYAPDLWKTYEDNDVIAPCSIDGQLVALPWLKKKSSKPILLFRKDLADQYGVDYSKLDTIEDMDAFFEDAKSKIPDITIFESGFPRGNTQSDVLAILAVRDGLDMMNYHMLTNKYDTTLIPFEQTDTFRDAVTWMKKWYDDGIVSKNELSETDTQEFKNGKTFASVGLYESAVEEYDFNVSGAELGYAEPYADGKFRYDSPLNNALAINQNAANPERTLMLLNLLNTNEEAYDLFMYGIEGETYVLDDDGSVSYPEGQDSTNATYLNWFKWPFVRSQFEKPCGAETKEALDQISTWLSKGNLVTAPLTGFNPDTSSIKTELSQRDQLYDEEGKLLLAGVVSGDGVDAAVDKYIEDQKNVGLDTVLDYLQGEADSYGSAE